MMEYGIINNTTNERSVMYGYSVANAYRRSGKPAEQWTVEYAEYID